MHNKDGLPTRVLLQNCAHVPAFHGNLLSIRVIDKAGGSAHFHDGMVHVCGPDKRILGVGRALGAGLYHMDMESVGVADAELAFVGEGRARSWEEWHRVYGHIAQGALETLADKEMVNGMAVDRSSPRDYFCEACVQAKHHVAPVPKESKTKYSGIGDLVVTDVWGPASTTSLQGNRYYVQFIDAYSRFAVVNFLKSTSEVLQKYKDFEALIRTRFNRPIKIVRLDNGTG